MGDDVHDSPEDHGPCCSFVECDILIEGDDLIERRATKHRYKIATDRKEDEYHIHVKNESSRTGDGW